TLPRRLRERQRRFHIARDGANGKECARKTDSVRVTIPSGTVLVPNPVGGPPIPNPVPITLDGTITSGSSKVKVA
ncbi:MAG: hypothetical protein HC933_12470, partial [Pleurocapsa sp. SU_196_0]|nr:hypothetical protein [Pleurocapsa sp. SU_196_0]